MKAKFCLKKIWTVILSLCMFISLAGFTVFAADISGDFKNQAESRYLQDNKSKQGISIVETKKSENGYSYKIYPETSGVSPTSIGYINVEIYGSGGNVYGKIWRVGTFDSVNFKFQLWAGDASASTKMVENTVTSVPAWPFYKTISFTPTATKFWDVTLQGQLNGQSMYYSTYDILFNKKAVRYPELTDAFGNVSMAVPPIATWTKVSNPLGTLTTSQLNAYKTWYQNTYNNGSALNWNDIQIHHVKPRAYGGTHAYSNLIPLHKNVHSTVTTWWANY
ncbi:MAG: HNH endonuclease signature motif containing protein [Bacillota bacterium]|nr:HNH endonuclease signature motif containing protein [Bacillota bacterium]